MSNRRQQARAPFRATLRSRAMALLLLSGAACTRASPAGPTVLRQRYPSGFTGWFQNLSADRAQPSLWSLLSGEPRERSEPSAGWVELRRWGPLLQARLLEGSTTIAVRLVGCTPEHGGVITFQGRALERISPRDRIAGVTTIMLWRRADHGLLVTRQTMGLLLVAFVPWWFARSYAVHGPYGAIAAPSAPVTSRP